MRLDKALLNPLSLSLALATVASFSLPNAAQAAQFNFSYTLQDGSILSGMMDGDVQADNDTVVVTAVNMASFNGVPGPALPFVQSLFGLVFGNPLPAIVSFSGNVMDIAACADSGCDDDGFFFDTSGFLGLPVYAGGTSFGANFEPYDPANWSLTPKSVPEPSAVVALALVGGGLLLSQRRKAA